MIIQVRGTSGSGKTWAMTAAMERVGCFDGVYVPGRKAPLYYECGEWPGPTTIAVLGHYETACGGCDTVGSAAKVFELIGQVRKKAHHVLCEGLLLSEDVKWTSQLPDVRCLFLTTPVEQCIEQIKKRRTKAGNDKPLKEDNTRNRVATIERARIKLLEKGIICRRCPAAQAPEVILNWLRGGT